jgi:peptidoglycan/xylan/chitin deacetylase (PgdA/CDA1 family)
MYTHVKKLLKVLISLLVWGGTLLYRHGRKIGGKKSPSIYTVLYYHRIDQRDRFRFARQMDELIRVGKAIPVHANETPSNSLHCVGVTFDDGFQSVLENAVPELVKRKIPVTLFIPTGYMGRSPQWIENDRYGDRAKKLMTEDQIRVLPAELVTFGSHTVTHAPLSRMNEKDLKRELIESKETLERVTGRSVTLLSLPYGMYNERVIKIAHEVGYLKVFSSNHRPIGKKGDVIERVPVRPSDWILEFRLKIFGAYRWLPFVLGLKRKLSVSNALRAVR